VTTGVVTLFVVWWREEGSRLDRFSKVLSHCPGAERPHWQRQPLARHRLNSGLHHFLAIEAAALDGSK
jgi:hypothetical protein